MQRVSLVSYLANVTLAPLVRKRLIGKPYVTAGQLLFAQQQLFELSMLLGYRFRNKLNIFTQLFSQPGQQASVISFLQSQAKERVEQLREEPTSFIDIFFMPELARLGLDFSNLGELNKRKITIDGPIQSVEIASVNGIAFGSVYPELVEKVWQQSYGSPSDVEEWQFAHQAGLNIPEKPDEPKSLEEGQNIVMPVFEEYLSTYRPEFINLLEN